MWSPVEGVEVVDYVEHAVGSGRFHNLQLFESVDSPWVVLVGSFLPLAASRVPCSVYVQRM